MSTHILKNYKQKLCFLLRRQGQRYSNLFISMYKFIIKDTVLYFSDNRNKMDGHHFRVFAAIYHPEIPHVFLSGGWDNTVHVSIPFLYFYTLDTIIGF